MADEGDKPHPATPKRREDARKEGKFPRARDTTSIAMTLAVVGTMVAYSDQQSKVLRDLFFLCHGDAGALSRGDGALVADALPGALWHIAAPPALAAALAGGLSGSWQSGFRLYPDMVGLKFDNFNPLPRLQQMVNPKHATSELLISFLRVGIVGWVCYRELEADVGPLLSLTGAPIVSSIQLIATILVRLTLKVMAVLVVLAVADFAYNRYTLEKSMRMSDQEIKEEMRQYDQNPKVKAKLREKARHAARRRVLAAVAGADAIVTNPTHISVALRYGPSDPAPVVVAKGHDEFALKIRAEARKHGIPILENRPLARALDAEVEIGWPVPGQHYVAVAKVLAFVYSLKGHRRRRSPKGAGKTRTSAPKPAPRRVS
ncbi:MAG: EscU/YscU/HrcU family type III secretion system export apparatus switch protein [Deltaproteobacteria bacterium]|nr:EscU/YscU/HrcU family type III secretion system export apparatus switch protein [Deltaproteobacteria bacterium]